MTTFPDHPVWDFAIRVYSAPGVSAACLDLQDRHAIDVTLLLFCLWHGTTTAPPLGPHLPEIAATAQDWHKAAVLPMRAARRWLKTGASHLGPPAATSLYRSVLAAEIDCEHAELLLLADLARQISTKTPPFADPVSNFAAFLESAQVVLTRQDRAAVVTVLAAAGVDPQLPAVSDLFGADQGGPV